LPLWVEIGTGTKQSLAMTCTRFTALAAAALVLLTLTPRADACTCMPFPEDEAEAAAVAYPQADAVFVGTVTAIKSGVPGIIRWRNVSFDVIKVWKGVTDDVPVVVRTATSSAACGYRFKKRETYLVFAYREPDDTTLTTNLCALNMPEREAHALMRELDKVKAAESATGKAKGLQAQNSKRRSCPQRDAQVP